MRDAFVKLASDEWGSNKVLGNIKVKHEPSEWLGVTWMRDRRRHALTMYMTKHIEDAVRRAKPSERAPRREAVFGRLGVAPIVAELAHEVTHLEGFLEIATLVHVDGL